MAPISCLLLLFLANTGLAVIPHEPLIALFSRQLGILPTVSIALFATAIAAATDYLISSRLGLIYSKLVQRRGRGYIGAGALKQRINKYPIAITFVVAALSLPSLPFKLFAISANNSLGSYVCAFTLGRLPRYWILATLGQQSNYAAIMAGLSIILLPSLLIRSWFQQKES